MLNSGKSSTDSPSEEISAEETGSPHLVRGEDRPRVNLVGTTLSHKFELIDFIGSGGMSEVYKARHLITGKFVAVKILHEKRSQDEITVRRLKQEAQTAGALTHNNIVGIHDFGIDDSGTPFLVMDFIDGVSLADVIKNEGPLQLDRFLKIMQQVASALAHAQERNIVHRDLKPSNIMLTNIAGKEQVKIVDFGIAKLLNQDVDTMHRLTQTGETFGSPLYMSPEQCTGTPVDCRADIYALGCVMFESLSGQAPFTGDTVFDTINRHINEAPPPLKAPQIDEANTKRLEGTILKCLGKAAQDRYQQASQVETELRKVEVSSGAGAFAHIEQAWNLVQAKQAARRKTKVPLLIMTLFLICTMSIVSSVWTVRNVGLVNDRYKKLYNSARARSQFLKAYTGMTIIYNNGRQYAKSREGIALAKMEETHAEVTRHFNDAEAYLTNDAPTLQRYREYHNSFDRAMDKFLKLVKNAPAAHDGFSIFKYAPSFREMIHETTKLQKDIELAQYAEDRAIEATTDEVEKLASDLRLSAVITLILNGAVIVTFIIYFLRRRKQMQKEKAQITESALLAES